MSGTDITVLQNHVTELDFIESKLEEKVSEIQQEITKIQLIREAVKIAIAENPELGLN